MSVQRIAVVCAVGAGKSTVARQLAGRLDLPLVDLDAIYWSRGTPPSEEAWRLVHSAVIRQPAWILDGTTVQSNLSGSLLPTLSSGSTRRVTFGFSGWLAGSCMAIGLSTAVCVGHGDTNESAGQRQLPPC